MKRTLPILAAVVLALAALPLLPVEAISYVLRVLTLGFIYLVLAQSYDIVGGTMGYVNLGHIAFFGVGAYAFGITYNAGYSLFPALGASLVVVVVFAGLISYPFFRLRGAYFSLAAFGLVKLMEYVTNNLGWLTGGSNGLKILAAERTTPMYYLTLGLVVMAMAAAWVINRSRLGLAMKSIREDEAVARDFGVPTLRVKTQALVISSLFPAVLGGLYMWYLNYINPGEVFGLKIALQPVAMALLGGAGLTIGPVVGTVFLYAAEELIWAHFPYLQNAMLGLIIVLVGLFMPGGIVRVRPIQRFLERIGLLEEDQ
jgi:branched-chain amino acid transport system permease protein